MRSKNTSSQSRWSINGVRGMPDTTWAVSAEINRFFIVCCTCLLQGLAMTVFIVWRKQARARVHWILTVCSSPVSKKGCCMRASSHRWYSQLCDQRWLPSSSLQKFISLWILLFVVVTTIINLIKAVPVVMCFAISPSRLFFSIFYDEIDEVERRSHGDHDRSQSTGWLTL